MQCNQIIENVSEESISLVKLVDFGGVPVDTANEKFVSVENTSEVRLAHFYRVTIWDKRSIFRMSSQKINCMT